MQEGNTTELKARMRNIPLLQHKVLLIGHLVSLPPYCLLNSYTLSMSYYHKVVVLQSKEYLPSSLSHTGTTCKIWQQFSYCSFVALEASKTTFLLNGAPKTNLEEQYYYLLQIKPF